MQTKYIVVLGSLMSGLGKGVLTSSILKLLDFYNYNVLPIKFDGYLNYDCGTMNPFRHGEVFVLDDKSEVDMDFGIYERFLNKNLTGDLSITGGKLFSAITSKERSGDFLGEDIQIIPHLTDSIIKRIERIAESRKPDVMVIEVGGTVGDIENSYFIEAMRQLSLRHDVIFVNLTYIHTTENGEQKTKPTQIGLRLLLQSGISPDFLVCRINGKLLDSTREKLSLFSNIKKSNIIEDPDIATLYQLPIHFMSQGFDAKLIRSLGLKSARLSSAKVNSWKGRIERITHPEGELNIAIVGKYTSLKDSYASVKEAIVHSGSELNVKPNLRWIESSDFEMRVPDYSIFKNTDAIIMPGGFGIRGTEGMVNVIRHARENKIPFLGICLGMQLMVVEFARNKCNFADANSSEFDPNSKHKVIDLLPGQSKKSAKGGTMRLGSQKCRILDKNSITFKSYGSITVDERHRHRYEFNRKYADILSSKGLGIIGVTTEGNLVEFVEWKGQFGVGTQAHPELKSRLESPAPLFVSLLQAAILHKETASGNKRLE